MYMKTHSLDSILRKDVMSGGILQLSYGHFKNCPSCRDPPRLGQALSVVAYIQWLTDAVRYAPARTALKGHACCRAPRGLRGGCHQPASRLVFSLSQFLILSLPSQEAVISASWLNILYTKFSLGHCFLRSQPATVCFIQGKNIYY